MERLVDDASLDIRRCSLDEQRDLAVVVEGVPYTFGDIAQRVEHALRSWPVHAGRARAPVALYAAPTLNGLVHFYAALALNVPCVLVHPRFSPRQVRGVVQSAGAHAYFNGQEWSLTHAVEQQLHERASLLLTTSGSTGAFKIVQHGHATLQAAARASSLNLPLEAADRWLLSLPYAHVGGVSILIRCLLARRPVVVAYGSFADPAFIHSVNQQGCTLYSLVPTQLHDLVSSCASTRGRPPLLRHVLVGGAPAALRLRRLAHKHGLRPLFTYGMTEAGSQITTQRPVPTNHEPDLLDAGHPLPGVDVRVDAQQRLSIRTPSLMLGYLGEAPLWTPGDAEPPWLMTNDRAVLHSDGRVQILGRTDHLLITGGENVDPEWVEQVLAEHPWVHEVAICGLPDPRWGERLVALVVPTGEAQTERLKQDLREFAQSQLPPFAVFKDLWVVEQLPKLGIGKLDRKQVLQVALKMRSVSP
jgi:O-succinylbenzoic acid--CoA ligase